jgi:hypothetical protein
MNSINIIIQNLTRYYQKRRLKRLVHQLPADVQSTVLHKLLSIMDIPDRLRKVNLTREIFRPYKELLEPAYEKKISDCRMESSAMLEKVQANVLAPNFPITHVEINHTLLDRKVKAKLTLQTLEEEVLAIPRTNKMHLFAAGFGILLSVMANFMTINMKLGNDWIGGNEILSTAGNIFVSLMLIVFEAIGLYILLHFMPRKTGNGLARFFGIIGAILIVLSVCTIIFSRAEIGSNATTTIQDVGKVE